MPRPEKSVSPLPAPSRVVDHVPAIAMYTTTNVSTRPVAVPSYDPVCRDKEHLGQRRPRHPRPPLWLPFWYGSSSPLARLTTPRSGRHGLVSGVFLHRPGRGQARIRHDSARLSVRRRHHRNPPSVRHMASKSTRTDIRPPASSPTGFSCPLPLIRPSLTRPSNGHMPLTSTQIPSSPFISHSMSHSSFCSPSSQKTSGYASSSATPSTSQGASLYPERARGPNPLQIRSIHLRRVPRTER